LALLSAVNLNVVAAGVALALWLGVVCQWTSYHTAEKLMLLGIASKEFFIYRSEE